MGWVPLVYFAVLSVGHRGVFTHPELPPFPLVGQVGGPACSDAVDGAARRVPRRGRGRARGGSSLRSGHSSSATSEPRSAGTSRSSSCSSARASPESCSAVSRRRSRLVHEHDARPERSGRRNDRLHAAGRLRQPAAGGARGTARGAGEAEGLLLNILPRSIAEGSRPRRIRSPTSSARVDPVRRRRGLHPARGAAAARGVVGVLDDLFSHFDPSPSATSSRRSRRSGTPTWSPRASLPRDPTMHTRSP